MTVVYEFEDNGANTTLARIRAGGEASSFYNVAGPLLSRMVRRGIERDLEQLRSLMEAGGPPAPASPGAPPA